MPEFPMRGNTLRALLLLAGLLRSASTARPNFVLILSDDHSAEFLGMSGNSEIRTPNLDRMARQGTRFSSFYVAQAVCSASRAALLMGCYPNRLGIHGPLVL